MQTYTIWLIYDLMYYANPEKLPRSAWCGKAFNDSNGCLVGDLPVYGKIGWNKMGGWNEMQWRIVEGDMTQWNSVWDHFFLQCGSRYYFIKDTQMYHSPKSKTLEAQRIVIILVLNRYWIWCQVNIMKKGVHRNITEFFCLPLLPSWFLKCVCRGGWGRT